MVGIAKRLSGIILLSLVASVTPLLAQVQPDREGVGQREIRLPEISAVFRAPAELPAPAAARAQSDLAALGLAANAGQIDVRSDRWATLMLAQPLIPGRGAGNALTWGNGKTPGNDSALGDAAWSAFRSFLVARAGQLRVDVSELAPAGRATVLRGGEVVQLYGQRLYAGIPVRGSYVNAVVNNGNLILFGANHWGEIDASTAPAISENAARAAVQDHVNPYTVSGEWGKPELVIVPLARGAGASQIEYARGYDYRLAWVIRPAFDNDMRRHEALVDAESGALISFEDTNHYATTRQTRGGVYPESNDGSGPEGVEQGGWPMPFSFITNGANTFTTDAGGNLLQCVDGTVTSQLRGPYLQMNDNCGAISLSSSGDLDFGTSGGIDCTTPGFGGAGNTHSSRSGFYEMNRIKEMARGQLPNNTWLQAQLQANMNINNTCNAFWNGTVNFYRFGGGCNNTGELAGVFDHEWGHGMDANDATPGVSNPGEGIADLYAALRLNTSCIGRGFRLGTNCGGYGDPCTQCDGVRDIDWANRASGTPHTFTWANANCGGGVHCRGYVYSEAVWDLLKRDLPAAPFNLDSNTAMEVVTRLTYVGAGGVGTWYTGSPPFGGCSASGGYLNYLAADDDNGNLNDGTPHMTAIYAAFNRHEIACSTPTVQNSGCSGTPTSAPVVTATPLDRGASLSWNAVPGATGYEVFRTDGVFACDYGKTKIATTTGTSYFDSGLQNGRQYSYTVIPKGPASSCFGPASSCTSVTPAAGPNLRLDSTSVALVFNTGDGDQYIDNCESATVNFSVSNVGAGTATNARIAAVRAVSHPSIGIGAINPITPSSLAACGSGAGGFDFTGAGLSFGDTVVFEVDITSDELSPMVRTETISFANAESDLQLVPSQTWDFESGLNGWTVVQGTFNQTTAGGGAGGSAGYVASSANLNNQCDQIRSPFIRLTASSTLSVQTNLDVENFSGGSWWDRANVAIFENGARSLVTPSSGRLYNASGPGAVCVTVNQAGWAAAQTTWAGSSWTSGDLNASGRAGADIQLDIAYGTDGSVVGRGFWFDQVTVTNLETLVPDGQSDNCTAQCTVNADCSDGLFCNGVETCNSGTCVAGSDPCPGQGCDETNDVCVPIVCNNNGTCESGEDCFNCPNDCVSGSTSGAVCGNGICEAGNGEDCVSCAQDCRGVQSGKPGNRYCCGDGDGQNPVTCSDARCTASGFMCTTTPNPPGSFCCGDALCDTGENCGNCALDCTTEPGNEVSCQDNLDNDCDTFTDCLDPNCSGTPACQAPNCSQFTNKNTCNAQPACRWDNRAKVCVAR